MARRLPYNPERGLTVFQVEAVVSSLAATWKNSPELLVVKSADNLPKELRHKIGADWNPPPQSVAVKRNMVDCAIEGIFDSDTNRAYLIAGNLKSKLRARKALFDIVKGHYGLRGFMGEDLDPFLDQVFNLYPKECITVAQEYSIDLDTRDGQRAAAEEVVAQMASNGVKGGIMERIFGAFRNTLRKIGFDFPVSEKDVLYVAACSGKYVNKGGRESVATAERLGDEKLNAGNQGDQEEYAGLRPR